MPRHVHKFIVTMGGPTRVPMTRLGKAVHVGYQHQTLLIWVDDVHGEDLATVDQVFQVYGTGHEIPPDSLHIGTIHNGPYMWHVYQDAS